MTDSKTEARRFCRTCVGELGITDQKVDFCCGACAAVDTELSMHLGYSVRAHERVVEASTKYYAAAKANDPKTLDKAMDVQTAVYHLQKVDRDTTKLIRRKDDRIQERRLREKKEV